ncbi:MAG: ABC transporter substrate-binding protein [Myxococcales bacterium]|nr:ABC transporter substrate-binding protein [Myxococcales bacterium]
MRSDGLALRAPRRAFLGAAATLGAAAALGSAASLGAAGCHPRRAPRGRREASLWFTYGGRNRQVLEELVGRFNAEQDRYWIHPIYQGDYYEGLAKLRTALAAQVAPALSHVVGEVIPYLAEAEVLEPLAGYPGASELDVLPALGQAETWQDGAGRPLVCLPFNRSTPIAYLNGALFDEAKLQPPTTWEELVSHARDLTVRSARGRVTRHGFGCPIDWWFWVALVGQAGGELMEGTRVTLGGDAGAEALALWQRMVRQDRSMKPPPGRDYNAWEQTNQDFLAGRTAMIWTSTAFLRYLEDNAPFPVRAAPLPAHRRAAVPTGGTHWIIPRSAPPAAKDAAWAFLKFMHEPAQVIAWATRTGYLPVTARAVEQLEGSGFYRRHPNDRVALDQLASVRPWPWAPELFRIQREIVQPSLENAVLGGQPAADVLTRARARATRELG